MNKRDDKKIQKIKDFYKVDDVIKRDGYYRCTFDTEFGTFYFLVHDFDTKLPFGLSLSQYSHEQVIACIKFLMKGAKHGKNKTNTNTKKTIA